MQSQYFCITVNLKDGDVNPDYLTQAYWQSWLDTHQSGLECLAMQLEEEGRRHVQMWVCFKKRKRYSQVLDILPGHAHLERMKGKPWEAYEYCLKQDTRVSTADGGWCLTFGHPPEETQGKRSDLETIRDMVKQGKTFLEIVDQVPGALRYYKEVDSYRRMLEDAKPYKLTEEIKLRPWQEEFHSSLDGPIKSRRIWWLWSPYSAVGKTTTMHAYAAARPGMMLVGDKNLSNLMCAYDKHRVIWFDFSRSDPLDAGATDVLEKLSNGGPLFAGKYQSSQKRVCAHIVVTCNRAPVHDRLPNRIDEWCLNDVGERVDELPVEVVE